MKKIFQVTILFFLLILSCKEKNELSDSLYENKEIILGDTQVKQETNIEVKSPSIPMNKYNFTELTIQNENIILNGDFGKYNFNYGDNMIYIGYFNREKEFDRIFNYQHHYDPELFETLENDIQNEKTEFSHWFFYNNMRKKIINNIIVIEGFRFSEYEDSDQQLTRALFFSSANYNIVIQISLDYEVRRKYFDLIIHEVPEYFTIGWTNSFHWKNIESLLKFGSDLLNGINGSKIAMEWYIETEELIEGLSIK